VKGLWSFLCRLSGIDRVECEIIVLYSDEYLTMLARYPTLARGSFRHRVCIPNSLHPSPRYSRHAVIFDRRSQKLAPHRSGWTRRTRLHVVLLYGIEPRRRGGLNADPWDARVQRNETVCDGHMVTTRIHSSAILTSELNAAYPDVPSGLEWCCREGARSGTRSIGRPRDMIEDFAPHSAQQRDTPSSGDRATSASIVCGYP
jgi:hypothetical protein